MERRRAQWREQVSRIDPDRLIFLDESGIATDMTRRYGRALGGRRVRVMSVIEVEGSTRDLPNLLLLTNRPTSPNSLHQLISNGVYPERQRILVAKGTTAPRAAYEPIAARIVEVNSEGATDVNPARFTFKHIRRPLFGVDD